jgi:maltooligosyltrehalose trehalohydrolase
MPNQLPSAGVLATDLDGTLIPLDNDSQNITDLGVLKALRDERNLTLAFVTGRHFDSVLCAISAFNLPSPDVIICDVGTTVYGRVSDNRFERVEAYDAAMQHVLLSHNSASAPQSAASPSVITREQLLQCLRSITELTRQEDEKQGPWKLSYYAAADALSSIVAKIEAALTLHSAPWTLISSVDPFNGDGLIDLLPAGVSKAFALEWWVRSLGVEREAIVFAGDSGNDIAALTAGFKSIIVGNADRQVSDQVRRFHDAANWSDRLCLASGSATSGVLEGCRFFGLV